jgi:hypothetical protein
MIGNTSRMILEKEHRRDVGHSYSRSGSPRGLFLAHNREQHLATTGSESIFK